jgi:hypothetical protein
MYILYFFIKQETNICVSLHTYYRPTAQILHIPIAYNLAYTYISVASRQNSGKVLFIIHTNGGKEIFTCGHRYMYAQQL